MNRGRAFTSGELKINVVCLIKFIACISNNLNYSKW